MRLLDIFGLFDSIFLTFFTQIFVDNPKWHYYIVVLRVDLTLLFTSTKRSDAQIYTQDSTKRERNCFQIHLVS